MQPVDALTAPDRREGSADTDAAAAAYWLRHPGLADATDNNLTAILLDK